MSNSIRRALALSALVAVALFGCSPSGVGGPCTRPGTTETCAAGAVCTIGPSDDSGGGGDPVWDSYVCRALCTSHEDCPTGEECRGVGDRSLQRACQPIER